MDANELAKMVKDSYEVHCPRCGRVVRPWPLFRGDRCAPKDWVHCIRPYYIKDGVITFGKTS